MNALRWKGERGHYEAYYAKVNETRTGAALWLRYTMLAPLAGEPVAQVWAVATLPGGRHVAHRDTFPASKLVARASPFALEIGPSSLMDVGSEGAAGPVAWKLAWVDRAPGYALYPWTWMYRARFPRTKMTTPHPDLVVTGAFDVAGERFVCDGAPGEQGHVWGAKHAESWAWAHTNDLPGGGSFELLTARVRLGRGASPPLTLARLRADGRDVALAGVRAMLRSESRYGFDGWTFRVESGGERVEGAVRPRAFAAVEYTDPDGEHAYCHNTKVADLDLKWSRRERGRWTEEATLVSHRTTAMEIGARTLDARVERVI